MKYLWRTILRWWWVPIVAISISVGAAFYVTRTETRFYVARATLRIGNTLESTLPDQNQLALGASLTRFYAELARREPILQPVVTSLQLPGSITWQTISDQMLTTNVVQSTNFLELSIKDSNPERAALIANAIGERLVAYSPTAPDKIEAQQREINRQIEESKIKKEEIQTKIDQLTERRNRVTAADERKTIEAELAQLEESLRKEQSTYQSLVTMQSNLVVNSLTFFERAAPPTQALPSHRPAAIGLAGLAGLLLSLIAIVLLEQMDNRWKSARDVEDRLKMANLGCIPIGPPLLVAQGEFAKRREQAVRAAHTNILLAVAGAGARSLLISSPRSNEDRSGFTIDIAYLFAQSGHRVLLIDADVTNPILTQVLLADSTAIDWPLQPGTGRNELWAYLRPTAMPNVVLLPGRLGDGRGLPAMVPSLRWPDIMQQLLNAADVIIFDGPAALDSADAALLAPLVDGVILALDPARDARATVEQSKARLLHQRTARLLGAVTFTPAGQPSGLRGIWKQLSSVPTPSLPAAAAERAMHASVSPGAAEPASASPADVVTPHVAEGLVTNAEGEHIVTPEMAARSSVRGQTGHQIQNPSRRRRRARADRSEHT